MSAKPAASPSTDESPPKKRGKKKLIIVVAVALLLLTGSAAGLWFSGVGMKLLKHGKPSTGAAKGDGEAPAAAAVQQPAYADLPDMIANLSSPSHHPSFVKLRAKVELARASDQPAVAAAMPRLVDLFQTYLREMRPEELTGSAGTYRLREELVARANIALAPVRVTDILFIEILIQ